MTSIYYQSQHFLSTNFQEFLVLDYVEAGEKISEVCRRTFNYGCP